MTRPIEQDRANWCTKKEACALTGRDARTIDRWISADLVRTFREPGGRVMVYKPDFLPPTELPSRAAS